MAFLGPRKMGATHWQFQDCITNTGIKVCKASECWVETWSSTENATTKRTKSYIWLHYVSTKNISKLVAPVAKLSPYPSILVPASTKTISLRSPVTSTLASSQTSSSQCISFEDARQDRETIFELHLRSELPKKISVTEIVIKPSLNLIIC